MIKPFEINYMIRNSTNHGGDSLPTWEKDGMAIWTEEPDCDLCIAVLSDSGEFLHPTKCIQKEGHFDSYQWKYDQAS